MNKSHYFSRRQFLKEMALAGAMLPFAGQMLRQNAFAAGAGYKNVLFFYHPNGVQPSSWNPAQGTGAITASDELSFALAPLQPWHSNIIVFKNIYIDIEVPDGGGDGGGHKEPMKGCLTGNRFCSTELPSIDHLIAEKLGGQGVLSLGVRTGDNNIMKLSKPRNVGNESRPTPNQNPFDVATKLETRVSTAPVDPLQAKIYAAALADLNSFSTATLTAERKAKLEQHKAALANLKDKQQEGTKIVDFDFSQKETIGDTEKIDQKSNRIELFSQYPALCKAQINNIVAAFANGIHRVASLQLGAGDENGGFINYSFDECWDMVNLAKARGLGTANHNRWNNEHASHGASHEVTWPQAHAQVRWHNSLLAYTLQQLKARGIFDETLVVTISDEGDGAGHDLSKGSIVLAGGAGGGLSLGRVIDCGSVKGSGTHKLFGDIARLLGAPVTEGPWKSGLIT